MSSAILTWTLVMRLTLNVVQFRLVHIDKQEDNETDQSHGEEEDERHVGVAASSSGDTGRDEWADEARCLADGVEQGKEQVRFWRGDDLGQKSDLVGSPCSHLELDKFSR